VRILAVIPARYNSTRFQGKVLAKDTGKFLIEHTFQQACRAGLPEKVIIAADDERIKTAAESFGAECVLTSNQHQSGTDRIAEAVKKLDTDIIINVQADEPELAPENIDLAAELLIKNPAYPMATLAAEFEDVSRINNPNIVKVVVDVNGCALYFSRSVIPYDRQLGNAIKAKNYLRHLGIYAYRKDFLLKITSLPPSRLEKIEKLEQLRTLENGFSILVGKTTHISDGIDTPQQYAQYS